MKKGCMYWLFIGFWLEPMIYIFKIILMIFLGTIKSTAKIAINSRSYDINKNFDFMDGYEFERFCAELLIKNGFYGVEVTQGSADRGIDVLAKKDGNNYAIQCKCYSKNVGNKAVQEAYSGKGIYRADVAVVMTNRYFTKQAIEDANSLGVQLWDRDKMKNLIRFSDKNNLVENSVEAEYNGKIIKEKIYMVRGITVRMQLNEYNEISVLIVDAIDVIVLACIFFYLYIEFRDKYRGRYSCKISAVYNGKAVNCDNEYIYGYNLDGSISRAIPDWLEKARNDLLRIGTENYMDIVSDMKKALCDFLLENDVAIASDKVNDTVKRNDILREYNDNREQDELRILDIEEKIVAVEDGKLSKYLYQYIEQASRIAIDVYLENGDGNPYTEDMIKNAEKPIFLYNVKCLKLTKYVLNFTYYCKMNPNYKNTNAYRKILQNYNEKGNKYEHDLFNISVYYNVEDIFFENKEVKVNNIPEVNIMDDDMETIEQLENIDEYDLQTGYKYLVTENFFPMKIDNIKFE